MRSVLRVSSRSSLRRRRCASSRDEPRNPRGSSIFSTLSCLEFLSSRAGFSETAPVDSPPLLCLVDSSFVVAWSSSCDCCVPAFSALPRPREPPRRPRRRRPREFVLSLFPLSLFVLSLRESSSAGASVSAPDVVAAPPRTPPRESGRESVTVVFPVASSACSVKATISSISDVVSSDGTSGARKTGTFALIAGFAAAGTSGAGASANRRAGALAAGRAGASTGASGAYVSDARASARVSVASTAALEDALDDVAAGVPSAFTLFSSAVALFSSVTTAVISASTFCAIWLISFSTFLRTRWRSFSSASLSSETFVDFFGALLALSSSEALAPSVVLSALLPFLALGLSAFSLAFSAVLFSSAFEVFAALVVVAALVCLVPAFLSFGCLSLDCSVLGCLSLDCSGLGFLSPVAAI